MRTLIATVALVMGAILLLGRSGSSVDVEAGTAVRMDVADLVLNSDLIVEGTVLSTHALRTADGRIETEYFLQVDRTFEGRDETHRAVRLPGGVLEDGSGMLLAGMPGITAGENVLLFLSPEASSGIRMPVGLAQGRLTVVPQADGGKTLVRNNAGVGLVNPVSGELVRGEGVAILNYAAVTAEIEAALAVKHSR